MSKKRIGYMIIVGIFATGVFLVVQMIREDGWEGNPYLLWSLNSVYSISHVDITHEILPNGDLHVHEAITYSMRKPFRMLYRNIPTGRYVEILSPEIWTEGIESQHVSYIHKSQNRVEAEIWLVPLHSGQRLDPVEHPNVTLHVRYTMRNTVEAGSDIVQFFPTFWGKDWDAPVSNIHYSLLYPSFMSLKEVFPHPMGQIDHKTLSQQNQNQIEVTIDRLPPFGYGEIRAVFEPFSYEGLSLASNPGLSWSDVEREESEYTRQVLAKRILPWVILLGYWLLILLIYRKMGKEPKIAYEGIYERELPTKDAPAIVNVIVKNRVGNLDQDGIGATIMNLYRMGSIELGGEENPGIRILDKNPSEHLSPYEIEFLSLLKEFAKDGVFDFGGLKKELKKSVSKAKAFSSKIRTFEHKVRSESLARKFFRGGGNTLSKLLGILLMILAFATPTLMTTNATPDMLDIGLLFSYLFWGSGLIILLMPKTVFGQWTPQGLEYYTKWRNFEAFLSDFSLLSEHPPESVVIWEEYLVYASALGIAEQVRKSLRQMIPQDIWQEQSTHPYFYTIGTAYYASQFYSIRNTAQSTVNASQSKSGGGFSGGAGGAGSGFGGGGGGAR